MYFIYVSNDIEAIEMLEKVLSRMDQSKLLIAVPNGYDLIQFLQNVKKGEAYPDLIILTTKFLRMSGIELLKLLKIDDIYKLIPVIMLLPEKNDAEEELCRRLGTDMIISPQLPGEWAAAAQKMCTACT